MAYEKKDIKENEIAVFQKVDGKSGTTKLRLVSWIIDGKAMQPMLEKRNYVMGRNDKLIMGKNKGFTESDLFFIYENYDDIVKKMQGHQKPAAPAPSPMPKQDDNPFADDKEESPEELFA